MYYANNLGDTIQQIIGLVLMLTWIVGSILMPMLVSLAVIKYLVSGG